MSMKKIFKNIIKYQYPVIASLLMILLSCSNDREPEGIGQENLDGEISIPLKLNLFLPTSMITRSETDVDGSSKDIPNTKEGIGNENIVDNLTLYFCTFEEVEGTVKETFQFVVSTKQSIDFGETGSDTKTILIDIKPYDLLKIAEKEAVRIYVVGNLDESLNFDPAIQNISGLTQFDPMFGYFSLLSDSSLALVPPMGSSDTTEKGYRVPVTNNEMLEFDFTSLSYQDVDDLFKQNSNANLQVVVNRVEKFLQTVMANKTVHLMRTFARVDFRDGTAGLNGNGKQFYNLNPSDPNCKVYGKIVGITPFNISRKTFLLPHTAKGNYKEVPYHESQEAQGSSIYNYDIDLFGNENNNPNTTGSENDSYTWVADYDWRQKRFLTLNWSENNASTNLFYFNRPRQTSNDINIDPGFETTYLEDKKIGNEVVSKGLLNNNNNYYYEEGNKRYYYWRYFSENTSPSTASMIRGISSGIAFKIAFCDGNGNKYQGWSTGTFNAYLTGYSSPGVTVTYKDLDNNKREYKIGDETVIIEYEEGVGNCITYWYFFRHNVMGNHVQGVMDPMQFAIVRNNIYRIAVSGFNGLPRPFDPEEPDEISKQDYIDVNLEVLSWKRHDFVISF